MWTHTKSGGVRLRVSGALGIAAIALVALGSAARTAARQEQATAAQASFEVASIKPNHSGSGGRHEHFTHGRLIAVNITAKSLIRDAYGLADYQISGAPDWVDSDAYDIDAKMDDSAAAAWQKLNEQERAEQRRAMFQSLLADRFNLKVSHETKELPIFALVVAKGGIKFSPAKSQPASAGNDASQDPNQAKRGTDVTGHGREYVATGSSVKMSAWAKALSDQPELDGRLAIDETGLAGEYDLTLKWTQERPADVRETPAALDTSGPSLFTALQEQLGLRLERKKGPVDTIVIAHIERPSEN